MISAPRKKTHVKKGDQVTVISGNHKGNSGKILQVLVRKDQVLVEGIRMIKKHAKKSQDRPEGGIIEREGPIHISNVKLVERAERPVDKKQLAVEPAKKPARKKKDA